MDQEHPWQTGFVQNQVNRLDAVFPVAAAVALDLIQRGEVRDQWVMPSVLPKLSIGALACHLGRQVVRAAAGRWWTVRTAAPRVRWARRRCTRWRR